MTELIPLITCRRCSMQATPHHRNPHLCDACVKAEDSRVSHVRMHNYSWVEVAKEADIELWERQPGETDHEYGVWVRYRDAYPGKKPSYNDVAVDLNTSYNAVKKVGQRWDFPVRMQAWIKHVDEITLARRREEILDMNRRHVDLATLATSKLQSALEQINPAALSVKEIVSLAKLGTDLERKARLHEPPAAQITADDRNPNLKDADVKSSDLKEVVEILAKSGVLNNFGIRQTVTTEVVVKDDD